MPSTCCRNSFARCWPRRKSFKSLPIHGHPEEPLDATELVDERQVLLATLPLNLVHAYGLDIRQITVDKANARPFPIIKPIAGHDACAMAHKTSGLGTEPRTKRDTSPTDSAEERPKATAGASPNPSLLSAASGTDTPQWMAAQNSRASHSSAGAGGETETERRWRRSRSIARASGAMPCRRACSANATSSCGGRVRTNTYLQGFAI